MTDMQNDFDAFDEERENRKKSIIERREYIRNFKELNRLIRNYTHRKNKPIAPVYTIATIMMSILEYKEVNSDYRIKQKCEIMFKTSSVCKECVLLTDVYELVKNAEKPNPPKKIKKTTPPINKESKIHFIIEKSIEKIKQPSDYKSIKRKLDKVVDYAKEFEDLILKDYKYHSLTIAPFLHDAYDSELNISVVEYYKIGADILDYEDDERINTKYVVDKIDHRKILDLYKIKKLYSYLVFDKVSFVNNNALSLKASAWIERTGQPKNRTDYIEDNVSVGDEIFFSPYNIGESIGKCKTPVSSFGFYKAYHKDSWIGDVAEQDYTSIYHHIFFPLIVAGYIQLERATVLKVIKHGTKNGAAKKALVEVEIQFKVIKFLEYDMENFINPSIAKQYLLNSIHQILTLADIDSKRKHSIISGEMPLNYNISDLFPDKTLSCEANLEHIGTYNLAYVDFTFVTLSKEELEEFWTVYCPLSHSINNKLYDNFEGQFTKWYNGRFLIMKIVLTHNENDDIDCELTIYRIIHNNTIE